MQFSPDERFQTVAEAYALDAVDFAKQLNLTLDWSDGSIEILENILDNFHRELSAARPTNEKVEMFAKMWGSYLGEVYRKNHGATWGLITKGADSIPGLQSLSGRLFWPWGRVENRLRNGREDNVFHYYLHLTDRLSS